MDFTKGILIASSNTGKINEIKRIFSNSYKLISPHELNMIPLDVEETGKSFRENALIKAKAYAKASSFLSLADDSGLEVFSLSGAPGIHSARYAGHGAGDEAIVKKLLKELEPFTSDKRLARFVCLVCLYDPVSGNSIFAQGECRGIISRKPSGSGGFGYDPIFIPDGYKLSMAELDMDVKNSISHRGKALIKLKEILKTTFKN